MLDGWTMRSLATLATFYSGGTPNKSTPELWGGDVPWVTVSDMKSQRFAGTKFTLSEAGARTLRLAPEASVLILVRGMTLFKDLPVMLTDRSVAFNQDIKALVPATGIDAEFLAYAISARKDQILRHVDSAGHGTGRLDSEILRGVDVPVPTLQVQLEIARFLRTWDLAIAINTRMRNAKRELSGALVERTTFGSHGSRAEMHEVRLGDAASELSARNADMRLGIDSVMGVSNSSGIVPMRAQTIGSDLSRYKILPTRGFAYNPMRLNVGSLAMSRRDEDVLVSPDYVLFRCLPGILDSDYFDHLRRSHWWRHHINAGGAGSVRVRTYFSELARMRLRLPSWDEQLRIASGLNTAREEVAIWDRKIVTLSNQRDGLLQELFSGIKEPRRGVRS